MSWEFCSKNKNVIDIFYNKRLFLWLCMLITSTIDIYLAYKQIYCNYTISKTFLTMLLLGYLKHYDEFILSHKKTNATLDFIAKYSFGLFFIHWYWFFLYNQYFDLQNVIVTSSIICTLGVVIVRFIIVSLLSFASLFATKKIITLVDKKTNSRMYIGI